MNRALLIAFLCLAPFALHASAVKECKVKASVNAIHGTTEKPVLKVRIKSASFERGHSMGEDCSFLESSLFGGQVEVELNQPIKTSVGEPVLLLYIDVRNVGPDGPSRHQSWEVHPDNGKE